MLQHVPSDHYRALHAQAFILMESHALVFFHLQPARAGVKTDVEPVQASEAGRIKSDIEKFAGKVQMCSSQNAATNQLSEDSM
jgi:hypothetical protein